MYQRVLYLLHKIGGLWNKGKMKDFIGFESYMKKSVGAIWNTGLQHPNLYEIPVGYLPPCKICRISNMRSNLMEEVNSFVSLPLILFLCFPVLHPKAMYKVFLYF
jgi:hypothetical protein